MPVTDYGDEGQVSFELKEWLDALVKAKVITNDLYVNVISDPNIATRLH